VLTIILSCVSLSVAELEFLAAWGTLGSGDGQFNSPKGIDDYWVDTIYVVDSGNNRIQCLDAYRGTFIRKWGEYGSGAGQFDSPTDVAVDSNGYVYVTDSGNDRVQKFSGDGLYLMEWGGDGQPAGKLNQPLGIALDDSSHVYVVDSENYNVKKFTTDGVFVTHWGGQGVDDGQFQAPAGITVARDWVYAPEVCVFVTDLISRDLQAFTTDGMFVGRWSWNGCGLVNDLCPGYPGPVRTIDFIWAVDAECHSVFGGYYSVGGQGPGDGQFNAPEGVAAEEYGSLLWVADTGNHRIQAFAIPGAIESRSWGALKAAYR
jgi:DNA-binding beta-propeller fold protein YncE